MSSPIDQVVRVIVRLIKRALIKFPQLALRFLEITFNPSGHLRQLALVLCVQISSFLLQRLRNQVRRGLLLPNKDERALDDATTYQQYKICQQRIEAANPLTLRGMHNDEFFELMRQRASTYAKLQANGDEFGLMYHLRSELMRKQSGGAGYSRDGSTWLRKHRAARERIEEYQHQVCSALRYIASGVAPRFHQRDAACFRSDGAAALRRRRLWRQAHGRGLGAPARGAVASDYRWHLGGLDCRRVRVQPKGRRAA